MTPQTPERERLDKWLWQARFFKTRSLSAKTIAGGRVKVDGQHVSKPSRMVAPGAVISFDQADRLRIVRVLALALRRGPASEAQQLYEDLTPEAPAPDPGAPRAVAGGRPTKRDRRRMSQPLE